MCSGLSQRCTIGTRLGLQGSYFNPSLFSLPKNDSLEWINYLHSHQNSTEWSEFTASAALPSINFNDLSRLQELGRKSKKSALCLFLNPASSVVRWGGFHFEPPPSPATPIVIFERRVRNPMEESSASDRKINIIPLEYQIISGQPLEASNLVLKSCLEGRQEFQMLKQRALEW